MSADSDAIVSSVPARDRGRVLTPSTSLVENGLFLAQVLLFGAAGLAPAILGGLLATGQLLPNNNLGFLPALVGLGLSAGAAWLLAGILLRSPWSSQYVFARTRAEFLRRSDAVVDPNHPEAIFTEIIPRRNWGQIMLQNAEDRGFLLIDAERRQLLFEGDFKRYRIPAHALIAGDVELMNESSAHDAQAIPVGLVVLKYRDELGERELPLRPVRTVAGDPLGTNHVERARELRRWLQPLLIDTGVLAES